jgi:hypothetical protein
MAELQVARAGSGTSKPRKDFHVCIHLQTDRMLVGATGYLSDSKNAMNSSSSTVPEASVSISAKAVETCPRPQYSAKSSRPRPCSGGGLAGMPRDGVSRREGQALGGRSTDQLRARGDALAEDVTKQDGNLGLIEVAGVVRVELVELVGQDARVELRQRGPHLPRGLVSLAQSMAKRGKRP